MADVRQVVQPDVAFVAAAGVGADAGAAGQPLADGDLLGEVSAAAQLAPQGCPVGKLPGVAQGLLDGIGDADLGFQVVGVGQRQQLTGVRQFLLGVGMGGESAPA